MTAKRLILLLGFSLTFTIISAQPCKNTSRLVCDSALSGQNRLTIYVIPSKVKYDWTTPHTLYKSYIKNSLRNMFSKTNYLLGHAFIDLQPDVPGERIMTGMRSVSRKEKKDLVLKQHYGLAILGCGLQGRLETKEELEIKLGKFSKKGRLAFMEFIISDLATARLTDFFNSYKAGLDSLPSKIVYGGAFWPRYYGEGAGCSAFAISFLDLAGILKDEFDEWLVKVDIPMSLIGGPYNGFNEVRLGDIRKEKSWANTSASIPQAYEHLEMYDPTLMYEWIHLIINNNERQEELMGIPVELNKAKGIRIDSRNQHLPEIESIFIKREKPSLFIEQPGKN
jgi:hypothetical protein